MEWKLPSAAERKRAYETLLIPAFPREELKPLHAIERMCEAGYYRPYCLSDGGALLGACFLWQVEAEWALVDYLCVDAALRGRGIGAWALKTLAETETDTAFIVESEAVCDAPDPSLARRRLDFYARCGLARVGYDTEIFGVHYHTLLLSPRPAQDAEVMRAHRRIYQTSFSEEKFRRFVHIPWDGTHRARTDWDE